MDASTILDGTTLNPEQRAAASFGDSPLLIIAGAGTGKTNTLAHRVAYLIASGVNPAKILLLTFTRRSAAEMSRRAQNILTATSRSSAGNSSLPRNLWSGTFHAIGNR